MAELSMLEFDSFLEEEDELKAYVEEHKFDSNGFKDLIERYSSMNSEISFEVKKQEKINWNEKWESNFKESIVNDKCIIRAPFHEPNKAYDYEIVINPRMSFGTGHHHTTSMMLQYQMELEHKGKYVLDVGCGTGILSIMASKLQAEAITACDIDEWSVENATENIQLNNSSNIQVFKGTIDSLTASGSFDLILANINKNIIINDITAYFKYLKKNGYLVLSGFYEEDVDDVVLEAEKAGFQLISKKNQSPWSSLLLKK